MAEQETTGSPASEESAKNPTFWRRLIGKKSLVALIAFSVVVPALGYVAIAASRGDNTNAVSPEVSLGAFWYETSTETAPEHIRVEFNLHLELLAQIDRAARAQLDARRFKVQQNVEELLRRAHNADFEDPSLTELKRQIQVQINETLGMRGAIAEVIVTDLVVNVLEVKSEAKAEETKTNIYRDLEAKDKTTNGGSITEDEKQ
ncbi:MAG: hypothetical protein MI757_11385 [Pirellulales bacterium]|nr:hypothetical protein [Pirellulales bacterium]